MIKKLLLKSIVFYQNNLSFGGVFKTLFLTDAACRYVPTCSEYSRQSIEKFGVTKGIILSLLRIIRCQPFVKGGLDPVPGR